MEKKDEIRALLRHLFSQSRRRKARILLKERFFGLVPARKRNAFESSNLPPDPRPDIWLNSETRDIDPDYFKRASVSVIEDTIKKNVEGVHADFEYTVRKVYGASSYTNESTHRSIFTRTGERINELSYSKINAKIPLKRQLPISKTIEGVTANIYGNTASAEGNYLHWFVDSMAQLFLIDKFHSLEKIDYLLVPPLKYDFHWDSLQAFGFDRSKVIELQPLQCLEFECLLSSSAPRGKGSSLCPSWAIDRYRQVLLEKSATISSNSGKKVYISRRDAPHRMFENENELCHFFENQGFDIVELTPLNLLQKIAVFRDAEFIVSQTGAGLTNLMFSRPGTKVLELVDEAFVYPLYASIAAYTNTKHFPHYFSNSSVLGKINSIVAKSSINIDELEKTLISMQEHN